MKKCIFVKAAALLFTLLFILSAAVTAFAAKSVKIQVEIAGSDGLLYVRLTAPASSDISTVSVPLNYDTSKLEFKEVSYIDNPSVINSTNSENEGTVIANTVISESLTEESKIFTYVFKIADGAEGKCEFSFGTVKATDSANKEINISFDGNLTASLSALEPLTPDKVQESFETTSATEPTTENKPQNADKPNIPNTTGKIAAISIVSVIGAAAIVVSAVAVKKKREN